jgi:hypothetical protein
MKMLQNTPFGSTGMKAAVMMPFSSVPSPPKAGKVHGMAIILYLGSSPIALKKRVRGLVRL